MASAQSMDVLDDTTKDMEMESTVDVETTPGSPEFAGVESLSARPVLSRSFYLGATYAIVLCGYYTANSFVSVLFQKVYFIGWSLLYFFYFVASFVGPSLRLPIKPTMAGCAVVYVLYIASINLGQDVVFLISSSIVGVTAGLFWLKSSEWISLESKRQNGGAEGALTGAFYGVFYFQGILGCGIALFILMFQADISLLIWCMCGLTGVGLVMTLFVPNVEIDAQSTVKPPSLKEKVLLLLKSASQRSVLFMIPMIFLQSAQVCFSYQFLPRLVRASTTEAIFPFVNVSTFFVYWVASIVVSFSYGKLFDKFGWKVVLACVFVIELCCIAAALPLMIVSLPSPYLWLIVGFFRGLSDTGTNAFILATITFRYTPLGSASPLFGFYRGLYSLGFFALGIATALISPFFLIGGLSLLAISGTICFIVAFRFPAM